MKRLSILLVILCVSLSVQVLAGWSGLGVVNSVYSHKGKHIIETTVIDNPCGSAGKFWWPTTDPDSKDMLAIALTAFSTGKNIKVVYDGNSLSCLYGGTMSTHIYVTNF